MQRVQEPFSYEHHQQVAELLDRVRCELAALGRDLDDSYGADAAAQASIAVSAIDRVRRMMHTQIDRDFPRAPDQVCAIRLASIYHPDHWEEQRRAG